eukprot:112115_1
MNKTQIVGYRRLRTLSQLFFETMPQILLQLRILLDDNNRFKIDVNTLLWSIGLAVAHLFLEGGIIYLDKSAFKMSFMEYALECLGGRVQWFPYKHLINNIIQYQLYIYRDQDRKHFNKNDFDAKSYQIRLGDVYDAVDDSDAFQQQYKWYWKDSHGVYDPMDDMISYKIDNLSINETVYDDSNRFEISKKTDSQAMQKDITTNEVMSIRKMTAQQANIYNNTLKNIDDILTLDYEKITTNPIMGVEYEASYQFSSQSMNRLVTIISNCSPMIIP